MTTSETKKSYENLREKIEALKCEAAKHYTLNEKEYEKNALYNRTLLTENLDLQSKLNDLIPKMENYQAENVNLRSERNELKLKIIAAETAKDLKIINQLRNAFRMKKV